LVTRGIDDGCSGRLREDRRRVADRAVIDAADIHRLHHRRPRRELDPFHIDALGTKMLLKGSALPRDHEHTVFLIADANFLEAPLCSRTLRQRSDRHGSKG
jgi:hypothetical protein